MRTISLVACFGAVVGCATGPDAQLQSPASADRSQSEKRVASVEQSAEDHSQRIRELEGRMAMVEAETNELRATMAVQSRSIGGEDTRRGAYEVESDDEALPAELGDVAQSESSQAQGVDSDDDGPRPVLRLYGSGSTFGYPSSEADAVFPSPTAVMQPPSVKAYLGSLGLLRQRRYDEAYRQFSVFVKRYPDHPYADNALYWMGELSYVRGNYKQAAADFRLLLKYFPKGNKVPDTLFKLARCLQHLGDKKRAAELYKHLRNSFPDSHAASMVSSPEAS